MRTKIAVLASLVLCANATAEPAKYAVDGLAVGMQLNFDDGSYREYACSPSDQFEGLTWCQKTQGGRWAPGSRVIYSLLHSANGTILYVNRSQEPAASNPKKAEDEIKQYSRMIGESPRVMKMPRRNGVPDGHIVVWGKVTLEQLDQESIKTLAGRKGLKKGLLIDFLGNFARSANAGLPIYRIAGGPGFVWAASLDRNARGVVRLAAVDLSTFVGGTAEQQPTTTQLRGVSSEAQEVPQPELSLATERVQFEVTDAATITAEPDKTKVAPVSGQVEVTNDEKANVEAIPAPLEAKSPVVDVSGSWESVPYEAIVGLLFVVLTAFPVICMRRHKARLSKEQALQLRNTIEPLAQRTSRPSLSPDAALARIEEIRQSSRRANESVLRVLASCRSGSSQLAWGAIHRAEK